MLNDIERLLDESNTQVLITTHSSFVANKLDLSNLIMLERKIILDQERFKQR